MNKLHHDFPLEKVFEFKAIKQAKSQKDIPTDDNGVPYVVQSTVNNMVARFVNKQYLLDNDEAPVSGNAIVLGVTLPAVSYQKNEFGASQVITARSDHLDEKTGIYLVGILSKYMEQFSYQRKPGMAIYKAMKVSFPVIENPNPDHEYTVDDIDWQYMRDRITELERDRITELDAYLQATGLNDYELTEDDKKILSLSAKRASDENGTLEDNSEDEVRFGEFLLKDIAKLDNGNKFDKNKMTYNNPSVYFVSRTASNNGVSDFVDNNGTVPYKSGCITLAFGGSIGSCFVQCNPFYTGQNVGVIDFGEDVSFEAKQYIAMCLGKYCRTVFTAFADEINKHFKTDLSVILPIKSDGTPDFDYMERYIRAMEKVVIADVVKYKDKVIETTKKVVGE